MTGVVQMKKIIGFTLIELVIAIALVSILTLIATEAYTGYVQRARRMDGINSLLSISLAEERYRGNNTSYGTLAQVWGGVTASTEGYYTLSITNVSATSYTITATATGSQTGDTQNGTACSSLSIAVSNGTVTKSPSACWPV